MHERIMNELSLEAGRNVLASVGDVVAEEDRQLVYTMVAQAVKSAIAMYEIKMAWLQERHIATEATP